MNNNKPTDLTTFGEILIDFTGSGTNDQGVPLFAQHPGGAPANVAVGASRLGLNAAFIGKAGEDMHGQALKHVLKREGVNAEGMILDADVFTTLAFVQTDNQGERTFSFARKPGADTQIRFEEIDLKQLEDTKVFHVGSLSLTDEPARETTWKAVQAAKKAGAVISYDPNYRDSLWPNEETAIEQMRSLISQADVMKISDEETKLLSGVHEPAQAAAILLEQGPKIVAVTLGSEGALVATQEGHRVVKGFPSKVADTNGAGDSFWAGMLAGLIKSQADVDALSLDELELIARFANACAALTVRKPGAIPAMPTFADVEAFLIENHEENRN